MTCEPCRIAWLSKPEVCSECEWANDHRESCSRYVARTFFVAQAQRNGGNWLTFPDAGPWADRYEAVSWAAGAAALVSDSSWRVIIQGTDEVIWEGPVPVAPVIPAGEVFRPATVTPVKPVETAAAARDGRLVPTGTGWPRSAVLETVGGSFAEGRATYAGRHRSEDRQDGPRRHRSAFGNGKRKTVALRRHRRA